MYVVLVTKPGHENTGVGRYAIRLENELRNLGCQVTVVHPSVRLPSFVVKTVRKWFGWDLKAFFENYPVWVRYPKGADIYHLTSQNLATLMIFCPPPGRTVITVHDIIPWITRNDRELRVYKNIVDEWFDRLALAGIKHDSVIIADSSFTSQTLVSSLKITQEKITVALLGIE